MLGSKYSRPSADRSAAGILLPFFLLFVAALAVSSGDANALAQRQAPEKPNIIFILADEMRADDFEHMPKSRQLLAKQGLTFDNAFVSYSLCCPSRASTLRGQYAHNHGVLEVQGPNGGFETFRREGHERSTVATWLQDSGYRTVLLGKYLNGYGDSGDIRYVPPGWDEWYAQVDDGYYNYKINENGKLVSYGDAKQDYYTDVLAREAKKQVRHAAAHSRPFFMYLAPKAPHTPYVPAPRHENAYNKGVKAPRPPSFREADLSDKPQWLRNLAQLNPQHPKGFDERRIDKAYRDRLRILLSLDDMVADLIRELQDTGELKNTYVFFTSDNGFHLGEHGISLTKRTPYEESHRVPLVVRGPGVPTNQSVDEIAVNTDFAPTFADLAGAPAPSFVDGRSLVPLLGGSPPKTSWRSAFLLENWRKQKSTPLKLAASTYEGVRTETHKYVEYETGEKELYDLSSDPYELRSQHKTANPALVERLKTRLDALSNCAGETCRDAEDTP